MKEEHASGAAGRLHALHSLTYLHAHTHTHTLSCTPSVSRVWTHFSGFAIRVSHARHHGTDCLLPVSGRWPRPSETATAAAMSMLTPMPVADSLFIIRLMSSTPCLDFDSHSNSAHIHTCSMANTVCTVRVILSLFHCFASCSLLLLHCCCVESEERVRVRTIALNNSPAIPLRPLLSLTIILLLLLLPHFLSSVSQLTCSIVSMNVSATTQHPDAMASKGGRQGVGERDGKRHV